MAEFLPQPSSLVERAHLRKRFPCIDGQIARAMGELADYCHGEALVRVFAEITPQIPKGFTIVTAWHAHIVAKGPAVLSLDPSGEIRFPVAIEAPGRPVKDSDAPQDFYSLAEAERHAAVGVAALEKQLQPSLKVHPGKAPARCAAGERASTARKSHNGLFPQ